MSIVKRSKICSVYDDIDTRKRLGLIILSSDLTTEPDYARIVSSDKVAVYSTRIKMENPTTPDNLRNMQSKLTDSARLFPEDHPPAAICYSCTAASILIGNEVVNNAIQLAWPNVPIVTPSYSAIQAFQALGVSRISVLTPYIMETSEAMAGYFTSQGLQIERFECLGIKDDRLMARVQHESIFEAACSVDSPESEAIFITCTALPALGVIAALEKKLGKPVVTSNQATAWVMLQYAGVENMPKGYGQLFNKKIPK